VSGVVGNRSVQIVDVGIHGSCFCQTTRQSEERQICPRPLSVRQPARRLVQQHDLACLRTGGFRYRDRVRALDDIGVRSVESTGLLFHRTADDYERRGLARRPPGMAWRVVFASVSSVCPVPRKLSPC